MAPNPNEAGGDGGAGLPDNSYESFGAGGVPGASPGKGAVTLAPEWASRNNERIP
jgi:hypothetical protein